MVSDDGDRFMTWLHRYRVRHYLRNSIWILPVAAMVFALVLVRVLHRVELAMDWQASFNVDTTRAVLGTLAGAMFTFIVFVCSSLLLVVQLASAQLTPRVIGSIFRDTATKVTLAIFVFTFTFALAALVRIDATVPALITEVAAYSCAASVGVFLFLVDHIGKLLRPNGIFESIATRAHRVIDRTYPRRLADEVKSTFETTQIYRGAPTAEIASPQSGVVLAFDESGLVKLAAKHDCVIEIVPQVGDFVARGNAVFRIHGHPHAIYVRSLRHSIAIGAERTMEQDPAFAFRMIVDIASKGLSPAINDPTTAVLAIDRIHHMLRHIGNRCLDDEKVRDTSGRIRLIYRTPGWDDFVVLAVTEIRQFGATSIQIARRLRAMLEDLIENLPKSRAEPLLRELAILSKSTARSFAELEDRQLAQVSDSQGVGGATEPADSSVDHSSESKNIPPFRRDHSEEKP
jgi:uncharacterized membrane protein